MEPAFEADNQEDVQHYSDPFVIFLGFPQISHMILKSLPMSDLLVLARVSRLWRRTAALRFSNEKCTAYVHRTCKDVCELNRQLSSADWTLINSLSVHIPREHGNCFNRLKHVDAKSFSSNLNKLPLRSLDLYLSSCKATQRFLKQLVLGAKLTLEELTLTYDPDNGADRILPNSKVTFPKLKVIEIHPWLNCWPEDMFDLVRVAPNLKSVKGECWLHETEGFNCTRLDVFTRMILMPFEGLDETLQSLVAAQPKLTVLHVSDCDDRIFPPTWTPYLLQLLRQCAFTLQRLDICAVQFLDLQREPFVLHALEFLELFLPEESTIEEFHSLICRLDLRTSCPGVKTLKVTLNENMCIHEMPQNLSQHVLPCAPIDSVRELITQNPQCPVAVMETCILSFPNLLSFGFEMIACAEICEDMSIEHFFEIHKIWTELPALEELKICLVSRKKSSEPHSLDALLCGLTVDEISNIKEMQGTRKTSLGGFQSCPVRPSLLFAENLRRVSLVVTPNYRPKSLCLPDVSMPLVFARKPELRLQITSHCSRISDELERLATLAEVTTKTKRCNWW